jgi:hypothetical protein
MNKTSPTKNEKELISAMINKALKKPVKDRTNTQHLLIIKEMYKGSVRNYLLSMGKFKEEEI